VLVENGRHFIGDRDHGREMSIISRPLTFCWRAAVLLQFPTAKANQGRSVCPHGLVAGRGRSFSVPPRRPSTLNP